MEVIVVKDSTFEEEVTNSELPVMVEFWAPWCGPCKFISPLLEEVAREFSGRAKVCKVNTDENPELVKRFNVRGIPAIFTMVSGEVKDTVIGAVIKGKLVDMLNKATAE